MSEMREHFRLMVEAFGKSDFHRFMFDNGKDYATGPLTYEGKRGIMKECYRNATMLMMTSGGGLTYVEGMISCHGVPIAHAWNVNADGIVVDNTLDNSDGRIANYFGIPFQNDFVMKSSTINGFYGQLDFYYNRRSLQFLLHHGLEEGQRKFLEAHKYEDSDNRRRSRRSRV